MLLKNTNPIGDVEIPQLVLYGRGVLVKLGETFEVPDEVGAEMLLQLGNYELATTEAAVPLDPPADVEN